MGGCVDDCVGGPHFINFFQGRQLCVRRIFVGIVAAVVKVRGGPLYFFVLHQLHIVRNVGHLWLGPAYYTGRAGTHFSLPLVVNNILPCYCSTAATGHSIVTKTAARRVGMWYVSDPRYLSSSSFCRPFSLVLVLSFMRFAVQPDI